MIITESNINEAIDKLEYIGEIPLEIICRNLEWFYQELHCLNKKIVSIVLPYYAGRYRVINQFHRKLCQKYGINIIDMSAHYTRLNLDEFWFAISTDHPLSVIMQELGKNIINAVDSFKPPKKLDFKRTEFKILTPKDFKNTAKLQMDHLNNSMYDEYTYKINEGMQLKFPEKFYGYYPIAIHTWNNNDGFPMSIEDNFCEASINYSEASFINQSTHLTRECCFLNSVTEINYLNAFRIDKYSFMGCNLNNAEMNYEKHFLTHCWFRTDNIKQERTRIAPIRAKHLNLIAVLLARDILACNIDINDIANQEITISQEYDFSALIPPVEIYKTIIEEYCEATDSTKFDTYKAQIYLAQQQLTQANWQIKKLQEDYNALAIEANQKLQSQQEHINILNAMIQELRNHLMSLGVNIKNIEPLKIFR